MDLATVIGAVFGLVTVLIVMVLSGSLLMYWDFMSIAIVIGGAFFATMMRWPIGTFFNGLKAGLGAVFIGVDTPDDIVSTVLELAGIARKESILALEKVNVENPMLAKGVRLAVDGAAPEIIEEILNDEIMASKKKHSAGITVYEDLGEAAPAFGMIGTVIGLIVIMANLADPSKIGPGLAVALVTTLYGAMAANMFFIPIAKKLKFRAAEHAINGRLIKTGVLGILNGVNPKLIEERLGTVLGREEDHGE